MKTRIALLCLVFLTGASRAGAAGASSEEARLRLKKALELALERTPDLRAMDAEVEAARHSVPRVAALPPFALINSRPLAAQNAQAPALKELVAEALASNPDLVMARRMVDAKRARVYQAGTLPDPILMSGVSNEGRAVPFDSLGRKDFSEVYLGVSQDLLFPGKLRLRENVAREEADAAVWAAEAASRRVAAQVAETYFDLYAAHAELGVAHSGENAARAEVRYDVTNASLMASPAERLLRLYDEGILKQARLSLDSALSQYQVGKVDFLTLLTRWRRLLDYDGTYHEQIAEHEKALARLAVHIDSLAAQTF
jgi:outer membrane protein TolC